MENGILSSLTWDAGDGKLLYQGVRYLLIRPETLASFQKAVEKEVGERAGELLYAGGFTGGAASSRKYRETFRQSDAETARFLCHMGGQIGWGRFDLLECSHEAGRLVVEVHASPFAEAYGQSPRPVCHFIRGVLAGLADTVIGGAFVARETSCRARGDARCRFEVTRT